MQFSSLNPEKVKGVLSVELAVPAQFSKDVKAHLNQNILLKVFNRINGITRDDEIAEKVREMISEVG